MIYEFEVPGKIIGKGRPRLNTYTGSVYTPTRTKDYESLVMQYFLLKYPRYKPFEGRVQVEINALFGVPKSTKKADKELMLSNQINPTKKPDTMNGIAFKDDIQITKLNVEKTYSTQEKVQIKISQY